VALFKQILLDFILCRFEEDFCHWVTLPVFDGDGSRYSFMRNSSKNIKDMGLPGPPVDIFGFQNTSFAFASNKMPSDGLPGTTSDLISPYLVGEQHKVECFRFYFYFAVSILLFFVAAQTYIYDLYNSLKEKGIE
jgi:hypothetical protein